jgi:hypothetical protein
MKTPLQMEMYYMREYTPTGHSLLLMSVLLSMLEISNGVMSVDICYNHPLNYGL